MDSDPEWLQKTVEECLLHVVQKEEQNYLFLTSFNILHVKE